MIRRILPLLFLVASSSVSGIAFSAEGPILKTTAWSLRVYDKNGVKQICSAIRGTRVQALERDENSETLKVKFLDAATRGKCPETAYIDARWVRPEQKNENGFEEAQVAEGPLSLRSQPYVGNETYLCGLPEKNKEKKPTVVQIQDGESNEYRGPITTWVKIKVKNPPAGCPSEGWVAASYLKPALDYSKLPVYKIDSRVNTETNCDKCNEYAKGTDKDPNRSLEGKTREVESGESPFLENLRRVQKAGACVKNMEYACSRGLVRMPGVGKNAAFCGTHHYSPDDVKWSDAYASPMTACAFAALAQEWRKQCPDRAGCTLQWGDISHVKHRRWNGHQSHQHGNCIDIRPFRSPNSSFVPAGLTTKSKDYSRKTTAEFIALAKKMGATTALFDDSKAGGTYHGGHANHIHLCFNNTKSSQKTCDNFKVDPKLCPELQ